MLVERTLWDEVHGVNEDVDMAYTIFCTKIMNVLHASVRPIRVVAPNRRKKWFDNELKN